MIKSFAEGDTERLFHGLFPRTLPNIIWKRGARKLLILHAASEIAELRVPPGNCLKKLKGDRRRQYSIRVNDQWRVCFQWREGNAYQVVISDYQN